MEERKPAKTTAEFQTATGAVKPQTYRVAVAVTEVWGGRRFTTSVIVQTNALHRIQEKPTAFIDDVLSAAIRAGIITGLSRGMTFEVLGWQPYPVNGQTVLSTADPGFIREKDTL